MQLMIPFEFTCSLRIPSPSASGSHASPFPSLSASSCPEFGTVTQLSWLWKHMIQLFLRQTNYISRASQYRLHCCHSYLSAIGVSAAKLLVGVAIDVCVFSAEKTISSPPNATLKHTNVAFTTKHDTFGPCSAIYVRLCTWQVMVPSLSSVHWALGSQGLCSRFPQLFSGLQPRIWSPVKPVLHLPHWYDPCIQENGHLIDSICFLINI